MVAEAGFEPTHPKGTILETATALQLHRPAKCSVWYIRPRRGSGERSGAALSPDAHFFVGQGGGYAGRSLTPRRGWLFRVTEPLGALIIITFLPLL